MQGRGSPRHAPGDEHRPRRIDYNRPREHPSRHASPAGNHGPAFRHRDSRQGDPGTDRLGHCHSRPCVPDGRRKTGRNVHHRGDRDEREPDSAPGTLPLERGKRIGQGRNIDRDRDPLEIFSLQGNGMGMTVREYSLFACGAICLMVFLFRTLAPYFRFRLNHTAESTARNLREDFLSLSPNQVRDILLSAGAITALAAMAATRDVFWMIVAGSLPALLCGVVVRQFRARRRKRIVSQLPAFLEILSGHVRAGHSIPESLQEAIALLPSGIREEVSWLCQSIRLGVPLPDALRVWEQRMACEEISLIVRPLCIAIPAGGNLHDLLTRSQAMLQALVLTLLPPGFIAVLSQIEPEYLARCRETSAGKTILAIAGVLQLLGWLSIRRIMSVHK